MTRNLSGYQLSDAGPSWSSCLFLLAPNKYTTSLARRYNIATTSRRCSDVVTTLLQRCVFAGLLIKFDVTRRLCSIIVTVFLDIFFTTLHENAQTDISRRF